METRCIITRTVELEFHKRQTSPGGTTLLVLHQSKRTSPRGAALVLTTGAAPPGLLTYPEHKTKSVVPPGLVSFIVMFDNKGNRREQFFNLQFSMCASISRAQQIRKEFSMFNFQCGRAFRAHRHIDTSAHRQIIFTACIFFNNPALGRQKQASRT